MVNYNETWQMNMVIHKLLKSLFLSGISETGITCLYKINNVDKEFNSPSQGSVYMIANKHTIVEAQ